MTKASNPPHFEINPVVVFRLGEELITDEVQALVELVKNSYDADASWAKITIDSYAIGEDLFANAKGAIVIEDDGVGMDKNAISAGWLTIAGSMKRSEKSMGRTTRKGRTPIGDKGLVPCHGCIVG